MFTASLLRSFRQLCSKIFCAVFNCCVTCRCCRRFFICNILFRTHNFSQFLVIFTPYFWCCISIDKRLHFFFVLDFIKTNNFNKMRTTNMNIFSHTLVVLFYFCHCLNKRFNWYIKFICGKNSISKLICKSKRQQKSGDTMNWNEETLFEVARPFMVN